MITSLRKRISFLFLAFFLLVTISVAATSWTIETQKQDALVINLAGRQRMLIQQMTKDALAIEKGEGEEHALSLQKAARTFDQTLWAFISGGQAPYPLGWSPSETVTVPATRRPDILAELHQVHHAWDSFRGYLDVIVSSRPESPDFIAAVQVVERLSPALVQEADEVVRMYEAASAQKVVRLRWIQATFFVSALGLLAAGFWATGKSVLEPLRALDSAAERMGHGDLNTPVEVTGPREIEVLARSFEIMRAQLKASREKLVAWAEELEVHVAQRTRELAALYDVTREISSRLDINYVLRSVTDKARELLDGEVAALCLLDETGRILHLGAASGPAEALCGAYVTVQRSLAAQVLTGDRALLYGVGCCAGSCGILAGPFRISQLAAPLRVGDRVVGTLCVGSSEPGAFSEEAARLLTKLANAAAIALENARLYEQAERVATLEERHRIAADMHDGLAQTLSYLGLKAERVAELVEMGHSEEAVKQLGHIRAGVDQISHEVRRTIASLQEGPSRRQALQDRLAETVDEFARNAGLPVELLDRFQAPQLLPSGEAEQVVRVVREALLNAQRHAQAGHIVVCLEQQGSQAVVMVEDDGRGFDPEAPPADRGSHFGLSIMRARAARIGGQIAIHSAPAQGTRVVLTWPVDSSLRQE